VTNPDALAGESASDQRDHGDQEEVLDIDLVPLVDFLVDPRIHVLKDLVSALDDRPERKVIEAYCAAPPRYCAHDQGVPQRVSVVCPVHAVVGVRLLRVHKLFHNTWVVSA